MHADFCELEIFSIWCRSGIPKLVIIGSSVVFVSALFSCLSAWLRHSDFVEFELGFSLAQQLLPWVLRERQQRAKRILIDTTKAGAIF